MFKYGIFGGGLA